MAARRRIPLALVVVLVFFFLYTWNGKHNQQPSSFVDSNQGSNSPGEFDPDVLDDESYFWRTVPTRFPVKNMRPLPTGTPLTLRKIQASFGKESTADLKIRLERQQAVKRAFKHCWDGYRKNAWLSDELKPVSGSSANPFGGWGATLVDSLDALWIMDFRDEFEEAVLAAAHINFATSSLEEVNAFETTIRYMGGLLAAYDLSMDQRLLKKAREVGDMLYVIFDTPNRMPNTRWNFSYAADGNEQIATSWSLIAEQGSLTLENTRLSLLTGNPKYFDATERITDVMIDAQGKSELPGLWPIIANPRDKIFNRDNTFSLGAMADSAFEYLPKMFALAGGLLPHYQKMYEDAMEAALKYNFYRPITPDQADILISGIVKTTVDDDGKVTAANEYDGQHLVCFAGGMLAIGGKLFNKPNHVEKARKLVDGCIWTYENMPLGIMPEVFTMAGCKSDSKCPWDEKEWKRAVLKRAKEGDLENFSRADEIISENRLPKGFTSIRVSSTPELEKFSPSRLDFLHSVLIQAHIPSVIADSEQDKRYILRPEAIESVFILYRVTGDRRLLDKAWGMFEAIQKHTETKLGNAALADVTVTDGNPKKMDSMESFWLGETLKYFYLIFSDPSLISLDEFVFNTEAHPLRRLV